MTGIMIVVPPGGEGHTTKRYDDGARPTLGELQLAVGGSLEMVPLLDRVDLGDGTVLRVVAYCNEEGKLNRLPFNHTASFFWQQALSAQGLAMTDVLVGTVVLLAGDADFLGGV